MKRLVSLLVLLCFVVISVFALEASVSWNWYKNDRNVKYFRYQLDAEDEDNWTVVTSNVLEATFDVDVSIVHVLYLQQSYDGIHWSESSCTESEVYSDEDFNYNYDFFDEFEEDSFVPVESNPIEETEGVEASSVVENSPQSLSFLNFAFSYRNSIPNHAVSKNIGFVAFYNHLFPPTTTLKPLDVLKFGFRTELGFYASEEIFTNISNTNYFVVASIQGSMNFAPSKGDFTISFGPEFQLKFGPSEPVFYVGLNARLEMRFNLSEKYSIGFSVANHFYFYPEKLNLYDMSAIFSINV